MAKTKEDDKTFKGSNGRTYRETEDGRVVEVYDPIAHAERQLAEIGNTLTITGMRFVDPNQPDAPATVVTITAEEAKKIVAATKEILTARTK